MLIALAVITIALLIVVLILQLALLRKSGAVDFSPLAPQFERTERSVREEIANSRKESGELSRELRGEVGAQLKNTSDTLVKTLGEMAGAQQGQMAGFADQQSKFTQTNQAGAAQFRDEVRKSLSDSNTILNDSLRRVTEVQKNQLEGFSAQLAKLIESNEAKAEALKTAIEQKLAALQEDNAKKLEAMRQTVDEKLQNTLNTRLTESFKTVSDQLIQVSKGLVEMQSLANGVGDLKKVLTNVKTRGTWGEIQLGNLLEQILTPDQYAANVQTNERSTERVEFAIKMPGHEDDVNEFVWLPIDAKFPKEDYERLVEAADRADAPAVEEAARQLETRIKHCARDIRDKYLCPPQTTDFGIMFLPSEGLYAEVLRRPGLVDLLQREYRVNLTGPTTLGALLNSLQMGFRTLAIQKRSGEIAILLGAVKTEFGKFGDVITNVKRKLDLASKEIDKVGTRTKAIERKLRGVEALPSGEAQSLLPLPEMESDEEEEMVGEEA